MKQILRWSIIILVVITFLTVTQAAWGQSKPTLAQYIDTAILAPYHSVITGSMIVYNRDHYGIPIVAQLCLLKIETNLGSPTGGYPFTQRNNFGCIRWYASRTALMGSPVPGRFWHWSSYWYRWATPSQGMVGFGRFLHNWGNGYFLSLLKTRNWYLVGRYYNGNASVYAGWCRTLAAKYDGIFKAGGYTP
jgi:hypothetical protein